MDRIHGYRFGDLSVQKKVKCAESSTSRAFESREHEERASRKEIAFGGIAKIQQRHDADCQNQQHGAVPLQQSPTHNKMPDTNVKRNKSHEVNDH